MYRKEVGPDPGRSGHEQIGTVRNKYLKTNPT